MDRRINNGQSFEHGATTAVVDGGGGNDISWHGDEHGECHDVHSYSITMGDAENVYVLHGGFSNDA